MMLLKKDQRRTYKAWLLLVLTVFMASASSLLVSAKDGTKQYQVLFHAGGDGTFQDGSSSYEVPGGVAYEGRINVDLYSSMVKPRQGYYFTGWSKASGEVEITKKTKFVAQYARLIDEIVYRVNYVDTEGNPVGTQKIVTTNKGASVSETALAVNDYAVDAAVKTMVVDQGMAEMSFVYTRLTETQPGETESVELPGGTTITVLPALQSAQAGAAGQGPSVLNPVEAETDGARQAGAEVPENAQENAQTAESEAQAEDAEFQKVVESPDGEVPLANRTLADNLWIIGGGAAGLLALTVLGIYLYKRRKRRLAGLLSMMVLVVSLSGNVSLAEEQSPRLETVDSNAQHITLNLFDYSTGQEESNNGNNQAINRDKTMKFVTSNGGHEMNYYTGASTVRGGIVENQLSDGYPYLTGGNGESLGYLFDPNMQVDGRETYAGMNHLFYKDAQGYYVFDSDNSYAEADVENGRFTVYDATPKAGRAFYPFDSFASVYDSNDWVTKENSTISYLPPETANHYLGMTMSADFYQPKNGRLQGQDMVFEFTGDDDVWVFIDGKLILDLGGIHDAATGTINFANGSVTINGVEQSNMFHVLGKPFEAYSGHSIDFFYLERGNYASNCKLKFNLPTIPRNSVNVTKEVVDMQDQMVDYAEKIDFHFLIDQNGQDMANRDYLVFEDGTNTGTGVTDENGEFTLRHGQTAVFSDLSDADQYEVKELGAYLNGYEVDINETEVQLGSTETGPGQILPSVSSGVINVSDTNQVTFKNKVSNTAELSIQKKLARGSESLAGKEYAMLLKLDGEPYTGTYHVDGKDQSTEDGILRLRPDQTATISGLPYGIAFEVEEIGLDGSFVPSYKIDEGAYDQILPEQGGDVASASGKIEGDCTVEVENRFVNREDGTSSVTVTKKWTGTDGFENYLPAYLQVTLYEDVDGSGDISEADVEASGEAVEPVVKLREENDWQYTWKNLKPDTDYIVKEDLTEGYEHVSTNYENNLTTLTETDRVTSCANLTYELGKNNLLLVKQTGNQGYFLWSAKDLKLTGQQLEKIRQQLQQMKLQGAGNIKELTYHFGVAEYPNIKLNQTENGWKLEFEGKSVWAQFWTLKYSREESITIENTVQQEKLQKGSLKITKEIDKADFENGDPIFTFRITDRKGNVLYRTLRFTKAGELTKSLLVENIPTGNCTVEELKTMRYTCKSENPQKAVIAYKQVAEVKFYNALSYEESFSHTDVVENRFTVEPDGTVTCTKDFLRETENTTKEGVKSDADTEN